MTPPYKKVFTYGFPFKKAVSQNKIEKADNMEYPFNDDYMVFDKDEMRYILTPTYVSEKLGIDLVGEINERNGINPQIIAQNFLNRVSAIIYGYIHAHGINTAFQDYFIATIPSLRKIILNAMSYQFVYMKLKGDLTTSTELDKRRIAIDELAIQELNKTVPELNRSILGA